MYYKYVVSGWCSFFYPLLVLVWFRLFLLVSLIISSAIVPTELETVMPRWFFIFSLSPLPFQTLVIIPWWLVPLGGHLLLLPEGFNYCHDKVDQWFSTPLQENVFPVSFPVSWFCHLGVLLLCGLDGWYGWRGVSYSLIFDVFVPKCVCSAPIDIHYVILTCLGCPCA